MLYKHKKYIALSIWVRLLRTDLLPRQLYFYTYFIIFIPWLSMITLFLFLSHMYYYITHFFYPRLNCNIKSDSHSERLCSRWKSGNLLFEKLFRYVIAKQTPRKSVDPILYFLYHIFRYSTYILPFGNEAAAYQGVLLFIRSTFYWRIRMGKLVSALYEEGDRYF